MGVLRGEDTAFLEEMAAAVVEACRIRPGEKPSQAGPITTNDLVYGPNTTGGTLIRPGGRCYPAFWVRDFTMSLESALIELDEQKHALLLTAATQQDAEVVQYGSVIAEGTIADHIDCDGLPVFFPGWFDDIKAQLGGKWGRRPPLGDHFYFAHMAWWYVRAADDKDILEQDVNGVKLIDRLDLAFRVPKSREDSRLVYCGLSDRGVNFGFFDSVIHTGELLFCSVLKYRAARELAELRRLLKDDRKAAAYDETADRIRSSIGPTFAGAGGLLRASTGRSCQPDVWGSALAVYVGALEDEQEKMVSRGLAEAYSKGVLAYRGNIRHVPTCDDHSDTTAWDSTVDNQPKNRYQNGAYWGTPTGWVCYGIAHVDEPLAARLAGEYVEELREGDFRRGPEFGSPWECIHPDGDYKQNAVMMPGVACPLAAFRRLGW